MCELPRISIVVPTRNRIETLKHCLKTILHQDYKNIEILICDNSVNNLTENYVSKLSDQRIVYIRSSSPLSMTDNWNLAYKHITGDYVIYIGDDDGLVQGSIKKLVNLIIESPADAYKWQTTEYQWPIDEFPPMLISVAQNPVNPTKVDIKQHGREIMRLGGWQYYRLPGIYHAALSKKTLDSIALYYNGLPFQTTQPDLHIAITVPEFASHYVKCNFSVSIQGRSALSNGGSQIAKNGSQVMNRYIKEFGDYNLIKEMAHLPFIMGWFMEPFALASKSLTVYRDVPFDPSAMWAFGYRIGFINMSYVIRNLKTIKQHSNFSLFKFLQFAALHIAAKTRRKLINSMKKSKILTTKAQDIHQFASEIGDAK